MFTPRNVLNRAILQNDISQDNNLIGTTNEARYNYLESLIAKSSDNIVPNSVTVLGVTFNAPTSQLLINSPIPTEIGSGDKIRLDAIPLINSGFTYGKTGNTINEQRGSYYYLSKILNNPKAGSTQSTNTTKLIPGYNNIFLSSGFGNRNVGKGRHEGIDITQSGGGLPMTCPFKKAKVIESTLNFNIMTLHEINPTTGNETGRGCRFLHSPQRNVKIGDIIEFGKIIGKEGTIGEGGKSAYASHSHFEMFVYSQGNSKVTVDGKNTSPSGVNKSRYLMAPTLEEIKCAHGMSKTSLRLPDINISNGIINYNCI
jgi:murein DD-endopeptidase MepM/ murein hydrolase activator NlpD